MARKYHIIDRIKINERDDWRSEVQLCSIPEEEDTKDRFRFRICYYTKQSKNGSEFWNIAPRPLTFSPYDAEAIKVAIETLLERHKRYSEAYDSSG